MSPVRFCSACGHAAHGQLRCGHCPAREPCHGPPVSSGQLGLALGVDVAQAAAYREAVIRADGEPVACVICHRPARLRRARFDGEHLGALRRLYQAGSMPKAHGAPVYAEGTLSALELWGLATAKMILVEITEFGRAFYRGEATIEAVAVSLGRDVIRRSGPRLTTTGFPDVVTLQEVP